MLELTISDPGRALTRLMNNKRLTERGLTKAWELVGKDWQRTTAKEIRRKPKAGRLYTIEVPPGSQRFRRHRASAPGETHAEITGKLRRSLGRRRRGHMDMTVGYLNKPPPYGKDLEIGTPRVKSRPTIRNGMKAVIRNAQNYFGKQVVLSINRRR